MRKRTIAAATLMVAIALAAAAKAAGYDIGLDFVLTFLTENGQ